MENVSEKYFKLSNVFMSYCYLNVLWILFTLLGFGFFGLFPATIVMFDILREWHIKQNDPKLFPYFFKKYKRVFLKANLFAGLFYLTGQTLLMFLQILQANAGVGYAVSSGIIFGMLMIFIVVLIYFFPIFSHFDLSFFTYIKWCLVISIGHPILTAALIGFLSISSFALYQLSPLLTILISPVLSGSVITYLVSKTFSKYEQ